MSDNHTNSSNTFNPPQNPEEDEIDLGELIATLLDGKVLIIVITLIALAVGVVSSFLMTPIYKADAMLQVEDSSSASPLGALEGVSGIFESKSPIQGEIEIIKSRMILGNAINKLHLDIFAQPKFFPVIGKAIARQYQSKNKGKISDPLFGSPEYAWGGESIKVSTLNVPQHWLGKKITLIVGQKGQFTLTDNDEQTIKGYVGKIVSKTIEGEEFRVYISVLNARPGTHFMLQKQPKSIAIQALNGKLSISEKGKKTGILSFTMESPFPLLAKNVLNEIANIYTQSSVEQKSAEAKKTLAFLDKQLPLIKNQLEVATTALNNYRQQQGSIDLTIETQGVLTGIVEQRTKITLLQQKRDELRGSFTAFHPSIIAIDKQISRLQAQIGQYNKKIADLPETQQVILRLSRDVQVNTELYTTLLNNSQTLKVAKAGTIGDVRIIDYAVLPLSPIKPKKSLIIAISTLLGLILAIAWVFIRKALHQGIEDPDFLEQHLDIPVYATVPLSPNQKALADRIKKGKASDKSMVLAIEDKDDLAVESLRSLRTTLHFAFLEAKNNIIMITGPSPGIGKSFISINLATVLADSGKKILLIDGDMRKGLMNKSFNMERDNGLSELILNEIDSKTAIRTITDCQIDFIPTGELPPNPSELLLHENFAVLLEELDEHYDHIIIDSPPILAVTDACVIGRMASATLLVVRSGEHSLRELQQSVKRFRQNDVNLKGIVFNGVPVSTSRYGVYNRYVYQYSYKDD